MPTAAEAAVPAGTLRDTVERTAWRVRLPTRRFFLALALVSAGVLLVASAVGAWVTSRNATTIGHAQDQGLGVASAATDFRTNLAAADAAAAGTLIAGGLEAPEAREDYVAHLVDASSALTRAGLLGTSDDAEDIEALANGLVEYSGLVETARANARQGHPVGAAYLDEARTLARDELFPLAERLRREGERRVARSANRVGGPVGSLALLLLVASVVVLMAAAVLLAGRSRRALHPALIAATVAIVGAVALVASGIWRQSGQLRAVASTEFDDYLAANDGAAAVSDLRVTEVSAVAARGSGNALYQQFEEQAAAFLGSLDGRGIDGGQLSRAVEDYRDVVVDQVKATDLGGDNQGAAAITREGESLRTFERASEVASDDVADANDAIARRVDRAADADVHPAVPLVLGVAAAALAVGGILGRGRRYR